jgi:hypothetical protein
MTRIGSIADWQGKLPDSAASSRQAKPSFWSKNA